MEDVFDKLNKIIGITKYSSSEVVTPYHIVKDMVDLLPNTIYTKDSTFIDPAIKSGRFLVEIYNRLLTSDNMIKSFPDEDERSSYILDNQLFGVATSSTAATVARKSLYNNAKRTGNIVYTADKLTKETIKGVFRDMKFSVVIGNPPYNRGGDIDFVNLGYDLSTDYCVMITPAKWQTAEANQKIASKMSYGRFREKIVPHMSKVVFYPDARDIFDIKQLDGITYFILDKKNNENCTVVNKCVRQKLFNNTEVRSIANRETLNNIGNAIIKYVWAKTSTRYTFSKDSKLGYKGVYIVDAMCNPGKNIVDTNGSTLLFSPMEIVMSPIDMSMLSDNATCIFESADINECKSFISWINLKLTRFIVLMNVSGYSGLMTNESFRFVPAPPSGKFDHIYTDEELYNYYNLSQKYRDVIEAVIKERK